MKFAIEQNNADMSEKLQMYVKAMEFFDDTKENGVYAYDLTTKRLFISDKIREKFSFPPTGEQGNTSEDWYRLIYSDDRKVIDCLKEDILKGKKQSFNISCRLVDKNGNKVWVNASGALRNNPQTELLVGRISEIPVGQMVDGAAGLRRMERFHADLHLHMQEADGSLMLLGIDDFKSINIAQGRCAGDEILKKAADTLAAVLEYPMTLYRLDGDCFAVIFPQKQQEQIPAFYSSVNKAMEKYCSLSAGVVSYRCGQEDSATIYQYAEHALDLAKQKGKNRLEFFVPENYRHNLEQIELLDEMRRDVHNGFRGFQLHYQPQINGCDYSLHGVEALLRYNSPTKGRVSPAVFIPLLEHSGLISPVGEWVLNTALNQCRVWRKWFPNLRMSVNVSLEQLQQQDIAQKVLNAVQAAGLPGDALALEVTESIQLQDYQYFNEIFCGWKQHGIQVAIDDFGTGYSSLGYLKSIEADVVKIDRCFVDHIQHNAYNYRLLSNMIELAHSAQKKVCCEGVETAEELMTLQKLRVDYEQGYLFARPHTVEQFEQEYLKPESEAYQSRVKRENNLRQMKFRARELELFA